LQIRLDYRQTVVTGLVKQLDLELLGLEKESLVSYLIQLGVKRIGINREFVYFDTETLKKPGIYFH
jgi:hypothetical protein